LSAKTLMWLIFYTTGSTPRVLHHGFYTMGRRMALAAARDAGGQAMARPDGAAPPARRVMSIYSVVKELITKELITKDRWRGKRQGGDEPRAQESGAKVYVGPCRSVAASTIFG
jgi:hypothetical protein